MSRIFCIPGILLLFAAFVLNLLSAISLPFLPALDVTRSHFKTSAAVSEAAGAFNEIRFGVWAPCYYDTNESRTCRNDGHGYTVTVTNDNDNAKPSVTIAASWTRGLAVHPVAAVVTFVALLLSFSTHVTVTLIASLVSFLAATITLIAFAIDIALFAFVKHQFGKLSVSAHTVTGPGFWLTFVSFILLLLAGCTVCFGRRRDRMSGATTSYSSTPRKGFFSRFRR